MKQKSCIWIAVLLVLSLGGCFSPEGDSFSVYYPRSSIETELLSTEKVLAAKQETMWMQALEAVLQEPKDDALARAFPPGIRLEKAEIHDRIAEIYLSGEAEPLTGMELTIARTCLVLTLTAFQEIDGVRIYIGEEEESPPILRADDFILDSLVRPGTEHDFIWYYTDDLGRHIIPEARSLVLRNNEENVEEYIFRELAAGPVSEGLNSVIPEGTRLLSAAVENKICTLNLSKEFTDTPPEAAAARITLCSIAASLSALDEIDGVLLLVEGEPLTSYGPWDISEPISADPYALARVLPGYGREIRLWAPAEGELLPYYLYTTQYDEKAALDEMVEIPPLGIKRVFPKNMRIVDVVLVGSQYTVTLSEEFIQVPPRGDPYLAVQSMVHLLDGFTPGATVHLEVSGKPVTEYFGVTLPNPLKADPSIVSQK